MARLSRADIEGVLSLVAEVADHDGPDLFPRHLLDRLEHLIPADGLGYQETDLSRRELTYYLERPEVPPPDCAQETLIAHDPLNGRSRAREQGAAMLSDFLTLRAVRRNPFWSKELRTNQPWGGPYHLRLWLDAPEGREREVYFARGQRDFSERDRRLLELLRPHLSRLRKNAELRQMAVLDAPDGLALTPREIEIVRWVARGKTNHEIAALLYLSPGTVRRHMDNVFSKLGVHTRTAAVARAFPRLMQPNDLAPIEV